MASVFELIAADQAQRKESPLVGLVKALAGGVTSYQQSRSNALQDNIRIAQQQAMQQEMMEKERAREDQLKQRHKLLEPRNPAFKEDKYNRKVIVDNQGNVSESYETKETVPGMTPYQQALIDLKNKELGLKDSKTPTSKAQESVDKKFGTEYAEYVAGGGYADLVNQISTLEGVKTQLSGGKDNLTGPIKGMIPQRFRPASTEAQQAVEQSVQRSLKQILGGQFTEKEGEAFLRRGYDPNLPESANATKLQRAINQLKMMGTAKQEAIDYFEQNGTLEGFKGTFYTIRDGEMVKATKDDFYKMMQPDLSLSSEEQQMDDDGIGWTNEEEEELRALEAEIRGRK